MINKHISFAGAGRVASALCRKIYKAGYKIDLVVSITENSGRSLADSCEALWSAIPEFPVSTDIIIVAVPDHALNKVLEDIKCRPGTLVVHTAGSFGLEVFPARYTAKGVFYPLQTFSIERKVEFTDLPLLIESSDLQSSALLEDLAASIGAKSWFVNTDQRIILHVAAVFICNFANHMLTRGKEVAEKAGVPFEIFYPLITETVSKAIDIGPEKAQTGPAVRNDRNTIEKHIELLSYSPELEKMYREITMSIINYYYKL
ncbi:MAG: DUF2520 domain-containing protein [Bacteroidales bacterium]|nr:DUF2520 domain-containing protein [Bacteroidales bacterium]